MKEIENRDDIVYLVNSFYKKIQKDELLGPIFNSRLTSPKEWEKHELRLVDFWESTLFHKALFKGNPVQVHNSVDEQEGHTIDHNHFGRWQLIWISNLNEHFTGEVAQQAKNSARNIAHHLYLRMFAEKPIAKQSE